jgi:hypothetical protein
MENKNLEVAILNLSGELQEELRDYFIQRDIKVVDPITSQEKLAWTHILTKDIHDFSLLRKTYRTHEKDIRIVSLTVLNDPQDFVLANGKLVLDEVWMKGKLGNFILDKFFQEYAGISLEDNYPKFQELGAFNITNPFSTGDYLDRMIHHAFKGDFAALSVKTYFDHIIMYLAGLKNQGKVGFPVGVIYGCYEDVFGLQLHFFVDQLMLEDITSCLSSAITKKPEEYLLNISVQSSDFFDFTFIPQVKKVVVTGLWSKDERIKIENKGLMFSTMNSTSGLINLPYEGTTSQLLQSEETLEDMTSKVLLPERNHDENSSISGEELSESLAEKISSEMNIEEIKEILSGDIPEDDPTKVVLGSTDEMEELVNLVKGSVEEEAQSFKISGGKLDVDKFVSRISAGIEEKAPGSLSVKSLGDKLPDSIKRGLFDFSARLGKNMDELTDSDMETFKRIEIPKIIKNETIVGNHLSKKIRTELKAKFKQSLQSEFMENSSDSVFSSLNSPEDEMRVKKLLKSSLKSSLENNFHLNQNDNVSEVEKNLLVKSLSVSLAEDEEKIRKLVNNEKHAVDNPLFANSQSEAEKKLQIQLKTIQVENESLKNKTKTLILEMKTLKESRSQFAEIQLKAQKSAAELGSGVKILDQDEELRKQFQQRLSSKETLREEEQKKLSLLIEREIKLIEEVKDKEMEARKLQLESTQKEALLVQELERANRQLKTKDLMLNKAKEVLQKMSENKDNVINSLQLKLDHLSTSLSAGPSLAHQNQLIDLKKQNQNLAKMTDMYKAKVAHLVTNLKSNRSDDDNSKEEVRRLQVINNQFKNQVDAANKEIKKYKDKVAYDMTQIAAVRKEKSDLEQTVKRLTHEMKKEMSAPPVTSELEAKLKKSEIQNQQLENQIKETIIKLKETEARLAESMKNKSKQATGDDSSKKVSHLEASVKKLTQDVIESRNQTAEMKKETNKLRQEKTALQNQLDKLKKDADKARKASDAPPSKSDSGGKAA